MSPLPQPDKRRRLAQLLYLGLAHHSGRRLNRTITVRFLGLEQPLCTRCSFQWAAFAIALAVIPYIQIEMGIVVWVAVLSVLPLPALADWITQAWGFRESTTMLRAITGTMLGCGFALELLAAIELDYLRVLAGFCVYCVYMLIIYTLFKFKPVPMSYIDDLTSATRMAASG